MPIYAYTDETIFTIDAQKQLEGIGCGVLICRNEIKDHIITNAITALKNDVEINLRREESILKTGFFHASRDSQHAHSHFCDAIRNEVKGIFDFSFYSNDKRELQSVKFKESTFDRCLSGSSVEFFNSIEEIILVIEGRPNLKDHHLSAWKDKIYKLLENSAYDIPWFKTYFPKINITIGDKHTPGLQVTDFILWCLTRANKNPKDTKWFDRIKFRTWHWSEDENGHNRSQYFLNEEPENLEWKYPFKFTKTETGDELIEGYIMLERCFWHIEECDFTNENIHLYADFINASTLCKSLCPLTRENLETLGRIFIRIFDSLPIYFFVNPEDRESWKGLFYAKHTAKLLISKGHIHMSRSQSHIIRWRYNMITNFISEFKQLMN